MHQIAESYLCAFQIGCLASSYDAAAIQLVIVFLKVIVSQLFFRNYLTLQLKSIQSRPYIQVGLDPVAHLARPGRQVWDDTLAIEVMSLRQWFSCANYRRHDKASTELVSRKMTVRYPRGLDKTLRRTQLRCLHHCK